MNARLVTLVVVFATLVSLAPVAPSLGAPLDDDGEIALRPNSGPNGQYAYIDGAGELRVEVDGSAVNAFSTMRADDVFDVLNQVAGDHEVWITDATGSITYMADGASIEGSANAVVVPGGGTLAVGFEVDASGRSAGQDLSEAFTVHAAPIATGGGGGGGGGGPVDPSPPVRPAKLVELDYVEAPYSGGYRLSYVDDDAGLVAAEGPIAIVTPMAGYQLDLSGEREYTMVGSPLTLTGRESIVTRVGEPRHVLQVADIQPVGRGETAARIRWSVQSSALDGRDPADLRVVHRTDAGWDILETAVTREEGGRVVVEAEAPHLSLVGLVLVSDVDYRWTTDDGRAFTGETVDVAFDEPGTHGVSLTVTDARGLSDTADYEITVNDRPRLAVTGPTSAVAGEPVTLSAEVTDEVGNGTTVTWELPDGSAVEGTSITRSFGPGNAVIGVTATDGLGASNTTRFVLQVEREPRTVFPDISVTQPVGSSLDWGSLLLVPLLLIVVLVLARRSRRPR